MCAPSLRRIQAASPQGTPRSMVAAETGFLTKVAVRPYQRISNCSVNQTSPTTSGGGSSTSTTPPSLRTGSLSMASMNFPSGEANAWQKRFDAAQLFDRGLASGGYWYLE